MALLGNIYGLIAYYRHARGDFETAEKYYKMAVKKGLTKIERLGTYAVLVMRKGEFELSLDMLNKLILKHPKPEFRIKIRLNRALINTKLGNFEEARVALEDIHVKARSKRVYQALGYLYVVENNKKAEEYNLEAYDYDPLDVVILDNLAQLYIQKKKFDKARVYAEKAFDIEEDKVDVLYHLVLIEEHDGNLDKAKEYARLMIDAKVNPMNDVSVDLINKTYSRVVGSETKQIHSEQAPAYKKE